MKEFKTDCDIGSVLIGTQHWTFAVPNIGGDGEMTVRVYDDENEFLADRPFTEDMTFVSSAQGEFGIYEYDCFYHKLHSGDKTINDALTVLRGRYGVYTGLYKAAFVKWYD